LNADAPTRAIHEPPLRRLGGSARPRAGRLPPALAVGLACLIATVIANSVVKHKTGIRGDDPYYERMVTHPGGPHTFRTPIACEGPVAPSGGDGRDAAALDLGYAVYMQAYGVKHGLDAPLVPTERVY
jgi:hypothetical protein